MFKHGRCYTANSFVYILKVIDYKTTGKISRLKILKKSFQIKIKTINLYNSMDIYFTEAIFLFISIRYCYFRQLKYFGQINNLKYKQFIFR